MSSKDTVMERLFFDRSGPLSFPQPFFIYFYAILLTAYTANTVSPETTYISLHSNGRLLCKHSVPGDEFHRVRWFKSHRDDIFEHGDPALVSWDNTSQPYTTDNYIIDRDFSLVINNISIHDEGLYRCQLTKIAEPYSFSYDVILKAYALPPKEPSIHHVNDTFINCSVDRVYPLRYPHVEFNHAKYAVQNEDGTYNTSVSGSIQDIPSESKTVSCSFPYFNYSQVSSVDLYPTTTILIGNSNKSVLTTPTDVTALASSSLRTKTTNIVVISIVSRAAVIGFIC